MLGNLALPFLRRLGLDVRRIRNIPFGVSWADDVRAFQAPTSVKTIFDVGAHIGAFTEYAATRFVNASLYAFEPVPSSFERLEGVCSRIARSQAHPFGFGEAPAFVTMTNRPQHSMNRILSSPEIADRSNTIQAELRTLDAFCESNNVEHIDLLKIDTEGHELAVLRGSRRMLSAHVDFILIECEFQSRDRFPIGSFFDEFAFLSPYGFRIVSFYTGKVDERGWEFGDVLYVRDGLSAPFRAIGNPARRALAP